MKSLFATQIHQNKLKLSSKTHQEILKTSLKLPDVDSAGKRWSAQNYTNGYTSYGSMSELHKQFTCFEVLKSALDAEVKKYTKSLGLKFDTGRLELSSLWVNLMPANCYHAFHFHPLSVISGTYYMQAPKGGSPIRFEDPRAPLFMASPPRKIQMDLTPKAGDVILFESWLRHEVPPHALNQTRVSVSFNYDWIDR